MWKLRGNENLAPASDLIIISYTEQTSDDEKNKKLQQKWQLQWTNHFNWQLHKEAIVTEKFIFDIKLYAASLIVHKLVSSELVMNTSDKYTVYKHLK